MTELPGEFLDPNAPAGTPIADQGTPADVWCQHKIKWVNGHAGYIPTEIDELHPNIPCRDYGAIPAVCQPAVPYPPDQHPNVGPAAVEQVRREVIEDGW